MKEKLIELINRVQDCGCDFTDVVQMVYVDNNTLAGYLIANGVAMQEWISVKDKLPEKNTSVLASTDNGIVFQCLYAYDGWDLWEGNEVNITYWQPMPQPPKGE